jgi:hypothetical protein
MVLMQHGPSLRTMHNTNRHQEWFAETLLGPIMETFYRGMSERVGQRSQPQHFPSKTGGVGRQDCRFCCRRRTGAPGTTQCCMFLGAYAAQELLAQPTVLHRQTIKRLQVRLHLLNTSGRFSSRKIGQHEGRAHKVRCPSVVRVLLQHWRDSSSRDLRAS